jgi:NADPH:quinone reductase-like Zn-dependent oxidoreductase
MTTVVKFHKTGGPEVLSVENALVGKPKRGEARVRHTAIGLNYIDTYHRSGLYPLPLPTGVGLEGAGVVEAARRWRHPCQGRRSRGICGWTSRSIRARTCYASK